MKIAIIHYHLGHGGVSEVIVRASRLMTGAGIKHVVLVGPSPQPISPDLPVRVIDGLGYAISGDADSLGQRLRSAAASELGGAPDIWHFHNHSLGKNPAVPQIVATLAARGERILLQIHDLAEDGRPQNAGLLGDRRQLYPAGSLVHYAFLNTRDRDRFAAAGLPTPRAHLLGNPVEVQSLPPAPSGPPLVLHPVRGIRRKNLGEILLLAALAPQGTRWAITRDPLDPAARAIHDSWQRLAVETQLPVEFDVVDRSEPELGAGSTFETWLTKSTHLVTTSVAEGFGMVFLESATRGRPLLGRDLPHLTRDGAAHQLHDGKLYNRLFVPADWIDYRVLRDCQQSAMNGLWNAWGREAPPSRSFEGNLDFGNLPEALQQRVICKAMESGMKDMLQVEINGELYPAAQWLAATLTNREPSAQGQLPSPQAYLVDLCAIYQDMLKPIPATTGLLDPEKILNAYLAPESFHFLTSPATLRRPTPNFKDYRAIIFDVYGTLLSAPSGGVKPDPAADALLRHILTKHGLAAPRSPSTALYDAVCAHHRSSDFRYPEVDLRNLWRAILSLPDDADITELVIQLEAAWRPARLMPGVTESFYHLASAGIMLGLLSNAQCNTLPSLGECASLFHPDLTILSYQQGIAKPSPALFDLLTTRLASYGIVPSNTLYIGNDPLHDIEPAALRNFRTALFTGDPNSYRAGFCLAEFEIAAWHRKPKGAYHHE